MVVGACTGLDTQPLSGRRLPASHPCHGSLGFSGRNPCCKQWCEIDPLTESGSAAVARNSSDMRGAAACGRESGKGRSWTWRQAQVHRLPPCPDADTPAAAGPAGPSGPSIRHVSSTILAYYYPPRFPVHHKATGRARLRGTVSSRLNEGRTRAGVCLLLCAGLCQPGCAPGGRGHAKRLKQWGPRQWLVWRRRQRHSRRELQRWGQIPNTSKWAGL